METLPLNWKLLYFTEHHKIYRFGCESMNVGTKSAGAVMVLLMLALLFALTVRMRPPVNQTEKAVRSAGRAGDMTVNNREGHRASAAENETVTVPLYVVMDYNGKLAVFAPTDVNTPEIITTIETDLLRRTDKELFMTGVPVYSDEELCRLLEDFGS